jgi:hypothetical protein
LNKKTKGLLVAAILLLIVAGIMVFLGYNNLQMPWASTPSPTPTQTPVPTVAPTPVKTPEPVATTPAPKRDSKYFSPSNAQMDGNYNRAVEIFSWFKTTTLPTDPKVTAKYNGSTYFKVNFPSITKQADLENTASQMFTADIVSSLINESFPNQYIEISGVLYAQPSDKGASSSNGKQNFSVIRNGDFNIIYRVETEILDPVSKQVQKVEKDDFHFDYHGNGIWLFSNFYII